jgi:subtilisin-like proprotein convertase family protein
MLGIFTNTFANTNLIVINDYAAASPYPSTIIVSGVGGTLIKATVTFANLTHSYPSDISALLESPSGPSALLMANAGGSFAVHGVTLTFDDAANNFLTQTNQIVSGTFEPTAFFPVAMFPAPAPPAPYATNLSSLCAGNPNGAWSLFVIDDKPLDAGVISNGWSLNLITVSPIASSASQPPQFGNLAVSNGLFQFAITSGANQTNVIQASTNLVNWIPIFTNVGSFTFTNAIDPNYPFRFYRDSIPGP